MIVNSNNKFVYLFYSQGPKAELYKAEEAIGLAKALNWKVVKGPYWKEEFLEEIVEDY